MTREEAINEIKSWDFLEGKEIEAIQTLIPELRERRIRKPISPAVLVCTGSGGVLAPSALPSTAVSVPPEERTTGF